MAFYSKVIAPLLSPRLRQSKFARLAGMPIDTTLSSARYYGPGLDVQPPHEVLLQESIGIPDAASRAIANRLGALSRDIGGLHILTRPMATSQFFLAVDIRRFLAPEDFQKRMEQLIASVKSAAPAAGYDEVMVAGDPEWRSEATRKAHGIPLKAGALERINATARELGVPELEPLNL